MVAVKLPDIMSGSIALENILSIRVLKWLIKYIKILKYRFPYDCRSVSIVLQPSSFFPNLYLIFQFIIIKNGTNKKSVGKLVKR